MSCSIKSCGFGSSKTKIIKPLNIYLPKRKINKPKSKTKSRRKSRRKTKTRRKSFGYKYLRNDQIINKIFSNPKINLTCDRA